MEKHSYLKDFFEGAGSILDIFPAEPKFPFLEKTNTEKLNSDWKKIGNDMYKGMEVVKNDQGRKKKSAHGTAKRA